MKRFNIIISLLETNNQQPLSTIAIGNKRGVVENLSDVIMYKYKAPLTVVHYLNGLQKEIKRLSVLTDAK